MLFLQGDVAVADVSEAGRDAVEAWEDVCGVCLEKSSPNCFALREPLNIINTTPNPRIRRTPAHVIFSFGSRLDSSSQESLSQNTVILHIKHSMSHAPSLLFPSHLSTTSISTCTLIRPSTRRLLTSSSHGDYTCADSSNVSFGPVAETTSPTSCEPKNLIEGNSIESNRCSSTSQA